MIRHITTWTLLLVTCSALVLAEEATTPESDSSTYELKYVFKPGEVIRYKVEHRATVDTKIEGSREVSKSRSASTKVWQVESVVGDVMKFAFVIEAVDMWQQSDGRDEIRYNSEKDQEVPTQYQHVASTIGKPLAVVTINDTGQVIKRESGKSNPDLGFGGIIFPLPKGPIAIGHTWSAPKTLKLREKDGRIKEVKVQVQHKLEKVSLGVATISMKTQVLTPLSSAQLKSQLIQQLSNGTVRFDLDAGRVLSKELNWDETVIGFNGPASNMKYLAKFTEDLVDTQTAQKSKTESVQ